MGWVGWKVYMMKGGDININIWQRWGIGDVETVDAGISHFRKLLILAMSRVETRGSENEEESKQRC